MYIFAIEEGYYVQLDVVWCEIRSLKLLEMKLEH